MQALLLSCISMPAHSLGKFLDADSGLARFSAHASRLMRLQRAYEQAVPPALVRSGRVANVKQGVVVILASSGAAAAKIRQVAPRLTDVFRQVGVEISEVQVKVQPAEPRPAAQPVVGSSLKAMAKQGLEKLSSQLPEDSPLKGALERFTRRVKVKEQ
ncbi:MAG: DUF721 domain-containing protein [Rhodocyclaceae bacterium]|nr:MAG: DUF721 domain-containing protein [Rhodocyclaceae bacterium]